MTSPSCRGRTGRGFSLALGLVRGAALARWHVWTAFDPGLKIRHNAAVVGASVLADSAR